MTYRDLRDFIAQLEQLKKLVRVAEPVSPCLEMTAISDAVLRSGGPALLFEQPAGYNFSCLTNLFGTPERVALGMGEEDINVHDQWAVESMGAIQDRTREHLGTSISPDCRCRPAGPAMPRH